MVAFHRTRNERMSRWKLAALLMLGSVIYLSVLGVVFANDQVASFDDRFQSAQTYFQQGRLPEALTESRAAAMIDSNRFEAPALAALVLIKQGRATEARTELDAARRLAPPDKQEKLNAIGRLLETGVPSVATESQRRQSNVLALIMEDADKAAQISDRQQFMREFMDKSVTYLKDSPDDGRIWILRALASLELDREDDGILAAREIKRLHLTESDDPKIARVVANLDRKGWGLSSAQTYADMISKLNSGETDAPTKNAILGELWTKLSSKGYTTEYIKSSISGASCFEDTGYGILTYVFHGIQKVYFKVIGASSSTITYGGDVTFYDGSDLTRLDVKVSFSVGSDGSLVYRGVEYVSGPWAAN